MTRKEFFATASARSGTADAAMTVSTAAVDRSGDRVIPEGIDLRNAQRNLPLLWSHDYSALPIGTVTGVEVQPSVGISASWKWLEGDQFAARVKNAWDQGVVRAASIGFLSKSNTPNTYGGVDHQSWELLEVSLCAVGANPQAVRQLGLDGAGQSPHRGWVARPHGRTFGWEDLEPEIGADWLEPAPRTNDDYPDASAIRNAMKLVVADAVRAELLARCGRLF